MSRKKNLQKAAAYTAAERSQALYDNALKTFRPYLSQAQDAFGPTAAGAKKRSARLAVKGLDAAQPHIDTAFDKLGPAIDAMLLKIQEDLLPKLNDGLRSAAQLPAAAVENVTLSKRDMKKLRKNAKKLNKQAKKNARKGISNLQGQIEPRPSAGRAIGVVALCVALLGGVAVLLRKYLASSDESGWSAHQPSTAYSSDLGKDTASFGTTQQESQMTAEGGPVTTPAQDATAFGTEQSFGGQQSYGNEQSFGNDQFGSKSETSTLDHDHSTTGDGGEPSSEPRPFTDAADVAGDGSVTRNQYGPGAYVGDNPPANFVIKGNERSMKYHVAGSAGFERTIPDVWFESEQAAEQAGFTKAQR